MIDQSSELKIPKEPEKPKGRRISRRNFLKLGISGIAGMGIGSLISRFIIGDLPNFKERNLTEEEKRLINEIISFRRSLGLEELPREVQIENPKKVKWSSEADSYVDDLPEDKRSYSMMIHDVILKIFGNNATRIVKGSKIDPEYPYGMSFDPKTRFCNISASVNQIPLREFTDYILHEACGHGSDPSTAIGIYPFDLLLRILHGKWRALSKAFLIEGQFFNHPGDLTFPLVKKYVGKIVGLYFTGNQEIPIVDVQSNFIVKELVEKIARKRGRDIKTLKFNKSVCREIGEELISLLRQGKIKFEGDLKKTYQEILEYACCEIYAEMFKYAILYPEEINNDQDIIEGIKEVISAIRGQSDNKDLSFSELRESIINPSDEVLKRHQAEKVYLNETAQNSNSSVFSFEEQEKLKKQQEEFQALEKTFEIFKNDGKIPPALVYQDEKKRQIVERFAQLYSLVIKKYPILEDTFAVQYKDIFDPEMHIWEIWQVEDAMDSGFVRNLLLSGNISDEIVDEILSKIKIIEGFVNSPAF